LDSKITSFVIRMETSKQQIEDQGVMFINNWMKKHGHKDRCMLFSDIVRIPEKSREKIFELLKDK